MNADPPFQMPEIPRGGSVAAYCAAGREDAADLIGGCAAWRKEGLPNARP